MSDDSGNSLAAIIRRRGDLLVVRLGGGNPRASLGDDLGESIRVVDAVAGDLPSLLTSVAPADVILWDSQMTMSPGWLSALRDAAYADTATATASAMPSTGDAGVSINGPYPRLPAALPGCVYIRADAISLTGGLDARLATQAGRMVDFCQRCVLNGLAHVLAPGVRIVGADDIVATLGTLGEDASAIEGAYPYYRAWVAASASAPGPLLQALAGRVKGGPLTVTLDASCLEPYITGTQVQALEIIGALWRTHEVELRVVLPRVLGDYAREALAAMDGITTLVWDEVDEHTPRTDVVHRTYQVSDARDVRVLQCLGDRLLLTQQDLIAYRNPGYFPTFKAWTDYQGAARRTLEAADVAVFIAKHGLEQGVAEGVVDRSRAAVVHQGVDHQLLNRTPTAALPAGADALAGAPFLLCLGTDYRHKNRLFALRVVEQMQVRHNWNGRLALAGPEVPVGGSSKDEGEYLTSRPRLAQSVVRLPRVSEAEKTWLLSRAAAVIYPTIHEGFGFLPFEAAQAGLACLCAPVTSLVELLPPDVFTLVPWDAAGSADRVMDVLTDASRAATIVEGIRGAAQALTWDGNAARLIELYKRAAAVPPRSLPSASGASVLVGDAGLLPPEIQRALAEMAGRRLARGPLFALIQTAHALVRLGVRLKRALRGTPS